MTNEEYQQLLKQGSRSFRIKNSAEGGREPAKPQQNTSHEPLAETQVKERNTGKVIIRYTSVTKRPLDSDNACSKYHTDALRYCGVIKGDSFKEAEIITTQRKCNKNESPHTIIEITYP